MADDVLTTSAQGRIRTIVERIERLEEDRAAIGGDLKEVYAEAKGEGFDTKILRRVVRLRKQDAAKRQEEEAILDLYLHALGDTPLERLMRPDGPHGGLVQAMADAVPENGSVTIGVGGKPAVKLSRKKGGPVTAEAVGSEGDIYDRAVDLVVRDRKASVSYVQRHFQIGYNSAAALVERMEREGVVGPANHAGKRQILTRAQAMN